VGLVLCSLRARCRSMRAVGLAALLEASRLSRFLLGAWVIGCDRGHRERCRGRVKARAEIRRSEIGGR
jgi:hypothetical protein